METSDCIIILDDYKARIIAQRLGVNVTGIIGVIIKAKLKNLIPSIKPILDKIKPTNFRLSDDLELLALREAGD